MLISDWQDAEKEEEREYSRNLRRLTEAKLTLHKREKEYEWAGNRLSEQRRLTAHLDALCADHEHRDRAAEIAQRNAAPESASLEVLERVHAAMERLAAALPKSPRSKTFFDTPFDIQALRERAERLQAQFAAPDRSQWFTPYGH